MESLDLASLQEWISSWEVSEEEKKKVQEDAKKAKKIKKQIQTRQAKQVEYANFLFKILEKFPNEEKILEYISNKVFDLDKNFCKLKAIFLPIVENENIKVSDYVEFIKKSSCKFWKDDVDTVYYLISNRFVWLETFWNNLWDKKNEFLKEIRKELQENIAK